MESWERMSRWMKKVYADNLFEQSDRLAGDRLLMAEHAWKQFCLIPVDFLQTPSGKIDGKVFRSASAFLMYHWDAGHTAGLSLGNALSANYNVAFTLLRSFLELLLNGVLFQCFAHRRYREMPSAALRPTDALSMFAERLSSMIKETGADVFELESNSAGIFDHLRSDWLLSAFSLEIGAIVRQVADWGIFAGLHGDPAKMVGELYGRLSRNVHERIERTNIGRAAEEGAEIFEWPAPILAESLSEFLEEFHLAMEIAVIADLNLLNDLIPRDRLREKCQWLLQNEDFRMANLRQAAGLMKSWGD